LAIVLRYLVDTRTTYAVETRAHVRVATPPRLYAPTNISF
jgi:hypothetical protein